MKKITTLILIIINLTCFSQSNKIDFKKIKELKIVSVSGSSISVKNGFVNTESSNAFVNLYDVNGKLEEQFFTDFKGDKQTKLKLFYGKCQDFEKSEDIEKINGKEKTTRTVKIIYDRLCRESKIIWIDDENSITEIEETIYDNENRKISTISKNSVSEITSKIMFSTPENNIEEIKAYFADNKFWYHNKIRKDENGNVVENTSFNENGQIENTEITKYELDSNKNIIKELHFDKNNKLKYKKIYLYNSDNLIEQITTTTKELGVNIPNLTENVNIEIYYYTKK